MNELLILGGLGAIFFMLERIAVAVEHIRDLLEALNDSRRTPRH